MGNVQGTNRLDNATREYTMIGNGNRLKGSRLGYHGRGVPDVDTIVQLQQSCGNAVLAGWLPAETVAKLERMQRLHAKAQTLTR